MERRPGQDLALKSAQEPAVLTHSSSLHLQRDNGSQPTGAANPSMISIQVKDSADRVKDHVAAATEVRQDRLIKDHSKGTTVMDPPLEIIERYCFSFFNNPSVFLLLAVGSKNISLPLFGPWHTEHLVRLGFIA